MGRRGKRRRQLGRANTASRRCQKLRYETEGGAETAAMLRAANDPNYPDRLRWYFCRRCLGWHLTSQAKGDPTTSA